MSFNGEVFGMFPSTTFSVTSQSTSSIGFQMTDAGLQIVNRPVFMNLIETMLLNPDATFTLTGVASASANTQIGLLNLNDVYVSQDITLNGILFFFLFSFLMC